MMFLLRSAFCLALVVSWMPDPDGEVARTWRSARSVATAGVAAGAACAEAGAACRAALSAVSDAKTPVAASPRRPGKNAGLPVSADTLSAADLAPPWRGHRAKPHV
jgi:hypothetical protein